MRVSWASLLGSIKECEKCPLRAGCSRVVPGEGAPDARLMCVGEGPGAEEDRLGRPFVGAAGQLLTKMLEAIDLKREEVYIGNVVKCRPPGNRTPTPEEVQACLPYLRAQVALVRPKVILALGATAGRAILDPQFRVTRGRGVWVERKGVWIMATYHPSALLREPSLKRAAWEDMQSVRDKLKELEKENA